MRINATFSERAIVVPRIDDWVLSPAAGVDRLMLDRIGDEVARATSIVRYAAGSAFERHTHAQGEEFLVLAGVFSDENGDYPEGTYVRNPPGSGHAPRSDGGCRILVKLRQFAPDDLTPVVIDTHDAASWPEASNELLLHRFGAECVYLRRMAAGRRSLLGEAAGGAELFLVKGLLTFDGAALTPESWLRLPPLDTVELTAQKNSIVYLKTGHLAKLL